VDRRERVGSMDEVLLATQDSLQAKMWTALPAIVQSWNRTENTVVAQPSIEAQVRNLSGVWTNTKLPLLLDVPVVFPGGGGFTMTFPLAVGDEVLVVFASRCIDAWWKYGGIQVQAFLRMHSLSDGFAIPRPTSVPRVPGSISAANVQIRADDGATVIEMTPADVINITAPGGVNIVGNLRVTGSVTAGYGTVGSVGLQTHTHAQGNDSRGDTEVPTNAPTGGT
jgi:hypothetical protein